ncbi:hypothetical protein ACVWZT_001341 [Pseudomonas sp. TE21394]
MLSLGDLLKIKLNIRHYGAYSYAKLRSLYSAFSRHISSPSNS